MAKEIEFAVFPLGDDKSLIVALHQVMTIEKVSPSALSLVLSSGTKIAAVYPDEDAREQHLKDVIRPIPLRKKGPGPVGF